MINISSTIEIYRPLAQVFAFMTASANDFEWQYGTLGSGQVSAGATRIGTSFHSTGHLMGRRMLSTFEVTEFEANRKYGFKSLSGPLQVHTLYTLEATAGHTRVQISTQANPVDKGEAHEGVLEVHMQKQLREDLALLKCILEER